MRAQRTQTVWCIDNVVKLHRSSLNRIIMSHGGTIDSHPCWNYDATWCQSLANFFLLYSQTVLNSSHFAVALFAQPCMRLITHIIIMIKSRYGVWSESNKWADVVKTVYYVERSTRALIHSRTSGANGWFTTLNNFTPDIVHLSGKLKKKRKKLKGKCLSK